MTYIETAYRDFCKKRFPRPTEEQVAEIETRIASVFPGDYRRYLLEYNGGLFTEPQFSSEDEGCPTDRLTYMNGIGATLLDAELATPADMSLFTDNYPAEIVPIGYTIMGNLVGLIMHPEQAGQIALKIAFEDEWFFLADGIEEFFALLRAPSDELR